jgi:uncharacterized protein YbaR (Trm112 family)
MGSARRRDETARAHSSERDEGLLELLACPACRGDLAAAGDDTLRCSRCGTVYPIREGVPVLLPPGREPGGFGG